MNHLFLYNPSPYISRIPGIIQGIWRWIHRIVYNVWNGIKKITISIIKCIFMKYDLTTMFYGPGSKRTQTHIGNFPKNKANYQINPLQPYYNLMDNYIVKDDILDRSSTGHPAISIFSSLPGDMYEGFMISALCNSNFFLRGIILFKNKFKYGIIQKNIDVYKERYFGMLLGDPIGLKASIETVYKIDINMFIEDYFKHSISNPISLYVNSNEPGISIQLQRDPRMSKCIVKRSNQKNCNKNLFVNRLTSDFNSL